MEIQELGRIDYLDCWQGMKDYTASRGPDDPDRIWLVEHPPVYTLGLAGRTEHLLAPGAIPVVHSDRGGQVTYHGPGQIVAYVLIDLARRGRGVRWLVRTLEQVVINLLEEYGIGAERREGAPGVYTGGAKIASLGLRVRRGCSYHGLALNVDLDLEPFSRINPCGMPGLAVTRLADLRPGIGMEEVRAGLAGHLRTALEP
ncbi:MAG: lipoyl(octanoyl) transferase LipB [Gammaproteobacteria bacterium]|nr:MAG: lipoyl(octanoyl) transferase LipB [Gammaproteobacteria bacterium]